MSDFKLTPNSSPKKKKSKFREYFDSFIVAALVAFFLRSFVVEAFKIPSKSMVPTLLVGDHLFVNKFTYGIRLPFTKKWLFQFRQPERGEVVVFIYPRDESLDFIKRVVGLPGDQIKVEGDDVWVNGQKISAAPVEVKSVDQVGSKKMETVVKTEDSVVQQNFTQLPFFPEWKEYNFYVEKMGEHLHFKQEIKDLPGRKIELTVPSGHFFVMGDNRDNSSDSREWGFVPMENLVGKAMFIWLSKDHDQGGIRLNRFGKSIE